MNDLNDLIETARNVLINLRDSDLVNAYWDLDTDEPHVDIKELNEALEKFGKSVKLTKPYSVDKYSNDN